MTDYKDFPEADITLVEGAVANAEHLEHIREIRQRTKILVSLGDCAVTGNVTALRNIFRVEDVLDRAYRENATVVTGIPTGTAPFPACSTACVPVHEVVKVDFFIPGCPPSAGCDLRIRHGAAGGPRSGPRRGGSDKWQNASPFDPVTRVEGHAKISIYVDDAGEVNRRSFTSPSSAASKNSAKDGPSTRCRG